MRDDPSKKHKQTWRERILARKRRIRAERSARTRALNAFNRLSREGLRGDLDKTQAPEDNDT